MTDITSSFLQQVGACKKDESGSSTWNDKHKARILKSPHKKLPFVVTAAEISKNIYGLQSFLKEHKSAYLDTSAKYISSSNFMTEDQKDDIDRETLSTIDRCKSGISSLQHSLIEYKKRRTVEGDVMSHLIGIVDILQQNLMDTASIFKKLKKERIKKKMQEAEGYFKFDAIKRNPLSPLRRGTSFGSVSPEFILKPKSSLTENSKDTGANNRNRSNSTNNNNNTTNSGSISPSTSPLMGRRSRSNSANKNSNNPSPNLTIDTPRPSSPTSLSPPSSTSTPKTPLSSSPLSSSPPPAPLSPINPLAAGNFLLNKGNSWLGGRGEGGGGGRLVRDGSKGDFNSSAELLVSEEHRDEDDEEDVLLESERNLLEQENASLQREFDTMVDQVRVIDRQLVEVSSLFDELTEHALSQKETMDSISDLTEGAIGHTKAGVNQLKIASKISVDFRLMVILILIIFSAALLFLHWYEE